MDFFKFIKSLDELLYESSAGSCSIQSRCGAY